MGSRAAQHTRGRFHKEVTTGKPGSQTNCSSNRAIWKQVALFVFGVVFWVLVLREKKDEHKVSTLTKNTKVT